MNKDGFHFFGQGELLYRLSKGIEKHQQEVIFLVGSGLSSPIMAGSQGVLGTERVIELIRGEFNDDPGQLTSFDDTLTTAKEKRYQAAFLFLQGRLGQSAANEIIRRAVLAAHPSRTLPPAESAQVSALSDEELRTLDLDTRWHLNPGTEALGKLVACHPERFGKLVLTTNFDPLIEVAIRRAGGECFKSAIHADGNLSQTEARGCHVAHLHGYWYGSDTLHSAGQLQQPRPHLKASLASLLRHKLIVVCGYGGWDDVFHRRDNKSLPALY